MGRIKSALEIAMEKTAGIEVDKQELARKRVHKQGMEIMAKALNQEDLILEEELKSAGEGKDSNAKNILKEGALEALLAQISLGQAAYSEPIPTRMIQLADTLFGSPTQSIFDQLSELYQRYNTDLSQLRENILQQIGPALEQKARMVAQQTGQNPEMIMEQDPEYRKLLSENLDYVRNHYEESLGQLKDYLRSQLPKE